MEHNDSDRRNDNPCYPNRRRLTPHVRCLGSELGEQEADVHKETQNTATRPINR